METEHETGDEEGHGVDAEEEAAVVGVLALGGHEPLVDKVHDCEDEPGADGIGEERAHDYCPFFSIMSIISRSSSTEIFSSSTRADTAFLGAGGTECEGGNVVSCALVAYFEIVVGESDLCLVNARRGFGNGNCLVVHVHKEQFARLIVGGRIIGVDDAEKFIELVGDGLLLLAGEIMYGVSAVLDVDIVVGGGEVVGDTVERIEVSDQHGLLGPDGKVVVHFLPFFLGEGIGGQGSVEKKSAIGNSDVFGEITVGSGGHAYRIGVVDFRGRGE